jgi:hypothetical protein
MGRLCLALDGHVQGWECLLHLSSSVGTYFLFQLSLC